MTKNPFINAFFATLYISGVVALISYGEKTVQPSQQFLLPVAMISLFTLSAAIMGYLFLYNPIQMFMEGKKKEGLALFLKTLATFAGITFVIFFLLFSGIVR